MPIKYQTKYDRVWIDQASDQYIDVRGVGIVEVAQLFNVHKEIVEEIYDRASGRSKKPLDSTSMNAFVQEVMAMAPDAACFLIYLAADDTSDGAYELVRSMPLGVQIQCLEKIGALTFASNGGVKNFLESVLRISTKANALADEIKKSPLSSSDSQSFTATAPS